MIHQMAYASGTARLSKCGVVTDQDGAAAFGATCPACLVPGAWPSEDVQRESPFGGKGKVVDKLLGRQT